MESETEYQLRRGNDVLGRLTSCAPDFPWMCCKFEPSASFAEMKQLFDDELRLLNGEDTIAWEDAYEKIRALKLRLVRTNGEDEISEFLLHIDGDEVWFRFSDN
jgi:hypothetical protein